MFEGFIGAGPSGGLLLRRALVIPVLSKFFSAHRENPRAELSTVHAHHGACCFPTLLPEAVTCTVP